MYCFPSHIFFICASTLSLCYFKRKNIRSKYNKLKDVKNMVSATETNVLKIYYYTARLICKLFYIKFLQYANNNVKRIRGNMYELTYSINSKMYKVIIITKRGPCPVLQVRNRDDEDITAQVLPYLGPNYDWHTYRFDTDFFNTDFLTFELADGTQKIFESKKD